MTPRPAEHLDAEDVHAVASGAVKADIRRGEIPVPSWGDVDRDAYDLASARRALAEAPAAAADVSSLPPDRIEGRLARDGDAARTDPAYVPITDVEIGRLQAEVAAMREPGWRAELDATLGPIEVGSEPPLWPEPEDRGTAVPSALGDAAAEPPPHLVRQSRAAWHFAQVVGDRVRFDHGRGRWLIWHGHRWRPDEDGKVARLWLDVLATRYEQALRAPDRERARLSMDVQTAGATNAAIVAGLAIAASMEPIATTADAWDPDPWVLGCENGVVELRTGRLRAGRPEDMISRSTSVAYDPAAECPRWLQFLGEVFDGDEELVSWYGLLLGTSLVGVVQELLAIHHGLGNNGKSVAVRALRHAIGDDAVVIPVETLVNAKRAAGEATPDIMALRGARLAFTSEPDQAAKLRGGALKRLASVDRMTGRSLYGATQTWEPTHTVHLATNHLPAVDDATEGFWRRVALVPWGVRFRKPGEAGDAPPEDPDLAAKLAIEGPGILSWAVRGSVAYAAGATLHPFPAAVRVRTDAYRADQDALGEFITERVVYERDAFVGVGALREAYREWCEAEAVKPFDRLGPKVFTRAFEERGHGVANVRHQTANGVHAYFSGARLSTKTEATEASGGNAGTSTRSSEYRKVRHTLVDASDASGRGPESGDDSEPVLGSRPSRTCPSCHGSHPVGTTCPAIEARRP